MSSPRDCAANAQMRSISGVDLDRVVLPLGGIGTGTVGLAGNGALVDFEVANRPAKGFRPRVALTAVRIAAADRPDDGPVATRVLEGPYSDRLVEGASGATAPNHGLPRFASVRFDASYPWAALHFSDEQVPAQVRLDAFNPMVPVDLELSSIPCAILRFSVANPTDRPIRASLALAMSNFIGCDGGPDAPGTRHNRNEVARAPGVAGVRMFAGGLAPDDEWTGDMAIAALGADQITCRTGWDGRAWGAGLVAFWDDFSGTGTLGEYPDPDPDPVATVIAEVTVAPGGCEQVSFIYAWRFPNRRAWTVIPQEHGDDFGYGPEIVGNWYCTRFASAWDVVRQAAGALDDWERRTHEFGEAVLGSPMPEPVREAALFNLSTLRSQTCFRTADGHFFGWEGCGDHVGSCHGSCTHVWNYELATPMLYGDWARDARRLELTAATDDDGLMSFRIGLPLDTDARSWHLAAADGQMGALVKLYREWTLSGDDEFLRRLWPKAKRAMEFAWGPGSWDGDGDGVMEGAQHNTMDVEYYGPNPQMQSWYLAALRCCTRMAAALGDDSFAGRCAKLYERGRAWTEQHLFNGEYFVQQIRPAGEVRDGLRHPTMGTADDAHPSLQIGPGCLVDQLAGQLILDALGEEPILDATQMRAAAYSVYRHNRQREFGNWFNSMRSFVAPGETGLVMCSYPGGNRPARPFPYYGEVMTGFEYTAALALAHRGYRDEALTVITEIRSRFRGRRRNPYDEAECGHHYVRAMASWGAFLCWSGFHYRAHTGEIHFGALPAGSRCFFSTGDAWGTITVDDAGATLELCGGTVSLQRVSVAGLLDRVIPLTTLRMGDLYRIDGAASGRTREH